jgi:thiamine-phosphate pyrophosphorylase
MIERTFGETSLYKLRTAHRQVRLATVSPAAARAAGLDGVHWPKARLRFRHASATKGLIETCSAHRGLDIARARRLKLDGVLVSTAFASASLSAKRPMGHLRLARLARVFPDIAIFALGGITAKTARRLKGTRVYGVALVSFEEISG